MDPRNQSPFNALPPVVVALAVVIAGLEMMFQLAQAGLLGGAGGVGWRLAAITDWGVMDPVWHWMWETSQFPPRELARWLAYPFLHGGFTHAAFVVVFVLALGNVLAPVYRGWRLLALFLLPAVAGGLAYVVLFDARQPLFGGFPGAYGLIGAFTYLMVVGASRVAGGDPRRAFLLIGFLVAIQPIFGIAAGAGWGWVPDWVAEIVAALAGYGLAVALFPGAGGRLRDRMRQR